MAMDGAASLASELLQKLSELEQKVEHHRQDMAAEFQRYSRQLLQNVPDDVSARVEKTIRDSIHNYPALSPALDREHPLRGRPGRDGQDESPSTGSSTSTGSGSGSSSDTDDKNVDADGSKAGARPRRWRGSGSPPPVLPHRSGQPPNHSPRSPHEREREFQGLFTPSYLPLLDGRDDSLTSPPPLLPPAPSLPTAPLPLSPALSQELTKDPVKDEQALLSPITDAPSRPEPIRRPTNDTLSSDDSSAPKNRRSALRRSSSSPSKPHSPRRVRFEVEGGEVLPTASPPLSPRAAGHTLSPMATPPPSVLVSPSYDSSAIVEDEAEGDGEGLLGSSPPLPKKVTSTDRLKALARSSTEDTSKWTMVGDLQDMDEEEEALIMGSRKKPSTRLQAAAPVAAAARSQPTASASGAPVSMGEVEHIEDVRDQDEKHVEEEDDEDEDDELLEMPVLSSFRGRKKFTQPALAIPNSNNNSGSPERTPTPASSSQTARAKVDNKPEARASADTSVEDDEDFFGYEPDEDVDGNPVAQKQGSENKPTRKYIQDEDDEANEEDDFFDEDSLPTPRARDFAYSTSPAISILKPPPAPSSLPSRHVNPAVGSYNGKPFTIPTVRNPEILEQAAKMGNVYTFVGSVDGRSGVDESTTYRPDATLFSGTPKSLSERLLMEEFEESRKQSSRSAGSK